MRSFLKSPAVIHEPRKTRKRRSGAVSELLTLVFAYVAINYFASLYVQTVPVSPTRYTVERFGRTRNELDFVNELPEAYRLLF